MSIIEFTIAIFLGNLLTILVLIVLIPYVVGKISIGYIDINKNEQENKNEVK